MGLNIIEVSSELSLQLKFQTSKPQGLLFLAAGENDYCMIELLSGNLQVRLKIKSLNMYKPLVTGGKNSERKENKIAIHLITVISLE